MAEVYNWRIVLARYESHGLDYDVALDTAQEGSYFVYHNDQRVAEFKHEPYLDNRAFDAELIEEAKQAVSRAVREVGYGV